MVRTPGSQPSVQAGAHAGGRAELAVRHFQGGQQLAVQVLPLGEGATRAQVDAALTAKLPSSLEVLNASSAQDKDSVTVTQATATKYHLSSIADLAPVAKDFVAKFRKAYGRDPDSYAAEAYDAATMAVLAVEAAGKPDRASVRDALAKVSFESSRGSFKFDDKGDPLLVTHVVKIVDGPGNPGGSVASTSGSPRRRSALAMTAG